MTELFLKLLNMSISAGWVVLAVMLLRLVFLRAPKYINCILWSMVGIRLCIPFNFKSILSLIPSAQTVPDDIIVSTAPVINSGIPPVDSVVNPVISATMTPETAVERTPLEILFSVCTVIWIVGALALFIWGIVSYILLRKRVQASIRIKNIWICDNISTPFILGFFKPRIYVPSSLKKRDLKFVYAHERAHIKRKDHMWKPFAFLLLCIYWFNPLIWVGYIFLCRDIEYACDEKVAKNLPINALADYSQTLLDLGVSRLRIAACPLAFGEVSIKTRVKNVLNYKKPAFWIIIGAVVICVVVSVCFLTDPLGDDKEGKNKKPGDNVTSVEKDDEDEKEKSLHSYVCETVKEATCSEEGELKYICSHCDDTYTEKVELLEHKYEKETITKATCTEKGRMRYTCSVCEYTFSEDTDFDKENHTYNADIFKMVKFITCTESGIKEFTCTGCGEKIQEDVPPLNHKWDVVTTTATCTKDGVGNFECQFCDETKTEEHKAFGHFWNPANCTAPKTCFNCALTEGEALGHTRYGGKCQRCYKYIDKINIVEIKGDGEVIYQKKTDENGKWTVDDGYFTVTNCRIENDGYGPELHFTIDCTHLEGEDFGLILAQPMFEVILIYKNSGETMGKAFVQPRLDVNNKEEWEESVYLGGFVGIPVGEYIVEIAPAPPYSTN